jgi:hypothetical protein
MAPMNVRLPNVTRAPPIVIVVMRNAAHLTETTATALATRASDSNSSEIASSRRDSRQLLCYSTRWL